MGKILLFLVVLCLAWYMLSAVALPSAALLAIALLGPPGLILAAWVGRRALDRKVSSENALQVTGQVHQVIMVILGSATIAAVRLFSIFPIWEIPIPNIVGLALLAVSSILLLASTANLILSGLGMPVAFLPTRQLASDWLYSWTRNPIVVSGLLFLFCLGVWMRSTGLVVWTMLLLTPAAIIVLRVFEERELEIRFGAEYLAYKARVPMLLPRIPPRSGRN